MACVPPFFAPYVVYDNRIMQCTVSFPVKPVLCLYLRQQFGQYLEKSGNGACCGADKQARMPRGADASQIQILHPTSQLSLPCTQTNFRANFGQMNLKALLGWSQKVWLLCSCFSPKNMISGTIWPRTMATPYVQRDFHKKWTLTTESPIHMSDMYLSRSIIALKHNSASLQVCATCTGCPNYFWVPSVPFMLP